MIRQLMTGDSYPAVTMTEIREMQCEACEKRLLLHDFPGLFDSATSDKDIPRIIRGTYYDSSDEMTMFTAEKLKGRVLAALPSEARYVSREERELLERLIIMQGRIVLSDDDDIGAAESLVNRLWCSFSCRGEEWILTLPSPVLEAIAAVQALQSEDEKHQLNQFESVLYGFLYLYGILPSESVTEIFCRTVLNGRDAERERIASCFMKACCEYSTLGDGSLLLIHPGVINPFGMMEKMKPENMTSEAEHLPPEMIAASLNGILPDEIPLHDQLCGALNGDLRPGLDLLEAAEDLRILVKQGVSYQQLEKVLDAMTVVLPTMRMKSALRQLYLRTPRWITFRSGLVN